MKFYCGIDLSARDCHVCVIDQQLKIVIEQKLCNELPRICQVLEPYKANLKIVVESTFNWYWLIDGLQAEGFDVVLAHTLGLYLISGLNFEPVADSFERQEKLHDFVINPSEHSCLVHCKAS
jgi:hypothetical protein